MAPNDTHQTQTRHINAQHDDVDAVDAEDGLDPQGSDSTATDRRKPEGCTSSNDARTNAGTGFDATRKPLQGLTHGDLSHDNE